MHGQQYSHAKCFEGIAVDSVVISVSGFPDQSSALFNVYLWRFECSLCAHGYF